MRFEFGHTHAYLGSKVRATESPADTRDADCLVEFSDGVVVPARFDREGDAIALRIPSHQTARGTRIDAKSWLLGPDGEDRRWRVRKRLPA